MPRPRDEDAARRIVEAASTLIAECGPAAASISEIAAAAEVGRQTIYRWWPSRSALVIDALVQMTDASMPYRSTGDIEADLRAHMRSVIRAFAGPAGALIKELVADGQREPEVADAFRAAFFDHRRDQARAFIAAAVERGEISADLDVDAVVYSLYAPLWLALLIGHEPLTNRTADRALDAVLRSELIAAGSSTR